MGSLGIFQAFGQAQGKALAQGTTPLYMLSQLTQLSLHTLFLYSCIPVLFLYIITLYNTIYNTMYNSPNQQQPAPQCTTNNNPP